MRNRSFVLIPGFAWEKLDVYRYFSQVPIKNVDFFHLFADFLVHIQMFDSKGVSGNYISIWSMRAFLLF